MGKLLYIATVARPDIATAVGFLCRKVSQPTQMDWNAAKRIIRYLKGTIDFKLKFSSTGKSGLTGYVDADWAGDPSDRKSTSGHLFLFKDGLISWTTRKQSTVTLSSTEAEYVAASQAGQEVIWLRQLLEDLDQIQKESTPIYEDNQGCIALAQTERINPRTKHIDVRYHFLRDLQEQGQMDLQYCPTEEMLADILTKPLPAKRHMDLTRRIGLSN
ncbi:secreted RxLR effector protein 161-like [Rana temporaria]|uniref:secreted RxLR effector protein 161-like n=1 Tax=Rana temporaria TaxID=8407 RepID=UPI001AADCF16|nr:secreted RxLR effector protein 161-like [Rana temporaria]